MRAGCDWLCCCAPGPVRVPHRLQEVEAEQYCTYSSLHSHLRSRADLGEACGTAAAAESACAPALKRRRKGWRGRERWRHRRLMETARYRNPRPRRDDVCISALGDLWRSKQKRRMRSAGSRCGGSSGFEVGRSVLLGLGFGFEADEDGVPMNEGEVSTRTQGRPHSQVVNIDPNSPDIELCILQTKTSSIRPSPSMKVWLLTSGSKANFS